METIYFLKQLDNIIDQYNKNSLNEASFFDNIKNTIKNFLSKNKDKIESILPKILDYVNKKPMNAFYKKSILTFILITILGFGFNISKATEIYQEKGVYDKVEWSDIKTEKKLDVNGLDTHFKLGDYDMKYMQVQEWYDSITGQLPSYPVSLRATFIVTISKDPSNPANKNFAKDDTPEEKAAGGRLLEKRKKAAVKILTILKNKLKDENISFEFDVLTKIENDKKGYFSKIEYEIIPVVTSSVNLNDDEYYSQGENQYDNNDNLIKPNLTGGGLDISSLSRNYQFVELLKLGNIISKRFNGDKIDSGDEYSKWIVNTRKHIKEFLTRLQIEYPEKGIQFDKISKSINPISGSITGVSNVGKQYQYVKERYIKCFENFEKELNPVYNKWNRILGQFFPKLTVAQAEKLDKNIDKILNYLQQMYGNSILNFTYVKYIDIKENSKYNIVDDILKQIGHKTLHMLGAHQFMELDENIVSFKIRGSKKYNIIKIKLNGNDTYDITFIRLTFKKRTDKKVEDVYNDKLREVLAKETGLTLSL
jgi:hypothetical protein